MSKWLSIRKLFDRVSLHFRSFFHTSHKLLVFTFCTHLTLRKFQILYYMFMARLSSLLIIVYTLLDMLFDFTKSNNVRAKHQIKLRKFKLIKNIPNSQWTWEFDEAKITFWRFYLKTKPVCLEFSLFFATV